MLPHQINDHSLISPSSETVELDALTAFFEAEAAYHQGIEQLRALERARDDALLTLSREMSIPELSAATGLSKDRTHRIVNRASRRAAPAWLFAAPRRPW
jgi:hypothetical protein